jgi:hypothetical protein
MRLYRLRDDIWINLDAVSLVIDRGLAKDKWQVRIYTFDGEHNYHLSTEEWTKFQLMLKENETV